MAYGRPSASRTSGTTNDWSASIQAASIALSPVVTEG